MDHIAVLETADNVNDSFNISYVPQELVAQTFAFAGTLDQTCDVAELDGGVDGLFRIVDLREPGYSLIWNGHYADVWLDGAKGVVCRLGSSLGYCIEQCAFSHVGQSDDS